MAAAILEDREWPNIECTLVKYLKTKRNAETKFEAELDRSQAMFGEQAEEKGFP